MSIPHHKTKSQDLKYLTPVEREFQLHNDTEAERSSKPGPTEPFQQHPELHSQTNDYIQDPRHSSTIRNGNSSEN